MINLLNKSKEFPKNFIYNGGILITSKGSYFTKESRIENTPVYKLSILGECDFTKFKILPLRRESLKIQLEIKNLNKYSVEYLALNSKIFNHFQDDFWNDWNPLNEGKGHDQIYDYIRNLIGVYNPKKVLIVGCGTGEFLDYFKEKNIEAHGIDSNYNNVIIANNLGRLVSNIKLQNLNFKEKFDMIIDPGVISSGVIKPEESKKCLDSVVSHLSREGVFIHVPFTRSLFNSHDLEKRGLKVLRKTEPSNLFSYDYPKQIYISINNLY